MSNSRPPGLLDWVSLAGRAQSSQGTTRSGPLPCSLLCCGQDQKVMCVLIPLASAEAAHDDSTLTQREGATGKGRGHPGQSLVYVEPSPESGLPPLCRVLFIRTKSVSLVLPKLRECAGVGKSHGSVGLSESLPEIEDKPIPPSQACDVWNPEHARKLLHNVSPSHTDSRPIARKGLTP